MGVAGGCGWQLLASAAFRRISRDVRALPCVLAALGRTIGCTDGSSSVVFGQWLVGHTVRDWRPATCRLYVFDVARLGATAPRQSVVACVGAVHVGVSRRVLLSCTAHCNGITCRTDGAEQKMGICPTGTTSCVDGSRWLCVLAAVHAILSSAGGRGVGC